MKDIKSYVIGFLTCACLFLIMGQTDSKTRTFDSIWVQEIHLMSDKGATVIKPNEIVMLDNNSNKSVSIGDASIVLSSDSTGMNNYQTESTFALGYKRESIFMATIGEYGTGDLVRPALTLNDSKGQKIATIMATDSGSGAVETYENGKKRVYLGGGGYLRTNDENGNVTVHIGNGYGEHNGGFLQTWNEHGAISAFLGNNTDQHGILFLNDKYGVYSVR